VCSRSAVLRLEQLYREHAYESERHVQLQNVPNNTFKSKKCPWSAAGKNNGGNEGNEGKEGNEGSTKKGKKGKKGKSSKSSNGKIENSACHAVPLILATQGTIMHPKPFIPSLCML
jgi:hypothetical protein